MTAAFVLLKNVNLTMELCVGMNCAGLAKNLSSFDICSLDTTEKSTDVIACFSVVKNLSEHFDTSNNSLHLFVLKANDFNFVRSLELSSFYSTCSNCSTTCDCENVLDRHKERKVRLSVRSRNVAVNSVHKLKDRSVSRVIDVIGSFESLES